MKVSKVREETNSRIPRLAWIRGRGDTRERERKKETDEC